MSNKTKIFLLLTFLLFLFFSPLGVGKAFAQYPSNCSACQNEGSWCAESGMGYHCSIFPEVECYTNPWPPDRISDSSACPPGCTCGRYQAKITHGCINDCIKVEQCPGIPPPTNTPAPFHPVTCEDCDVTGNTYVDLFDLVTISSCNGSIGPSWRNVGGVSCQKADLNHDNVVNLIDLEHFKSQAGCYQFYSTYCSVSLPTLTPTLSISPTVTPTPYQPPTNTPYLPPTMTPTPPGIQCNTISLSCLPSPAQIGNNITFTVTGDGSTWVGDTWIPSGRVTGNGCSCTSVSNSGNSCGFSPTKTCQATQTGTYTWTHYWKKCVGDINNCSPQCSVSIVCGIGVTPPTPTPTHIPTPTPTTTRAIMPTNTSTPTPITPFCVCAQAKVYDESWIPINPTEIQAGKHYRFAVQSSGESVSKTRFRINNGTDSSWCYSTGRLIVDNWCETTLKRAETNEFWIEYPIPAAGGRFTVQAEVACSTTGWK